MLQRSVNEGFSGGEKKRNEIFHMAVLEPTLAMLDETDSGLDIDALRVVSDGVNAMRSPERAFIVVTHYQRLLNYIVPDYVHVLSDGRIVRSGGRELALELEEKGYGWLEAPSTGSGQAAVASAGVTHATSAPAWVRGAPRDSGGRVFAEIGFPTTRQEDWRFTNVAPIADAQVRAGRRRVAQARVAGRRRRACPARCGWRSSTASSPRPVGSRARCPRACASPACATARATAPTASSSTSARSSTSTRIRLRRSTPRSSTTAWRSS